MAFAEEQPGRWSKSRSGKHGGWTNWAGFKGAKQKVSWEHPPAQMDSRKLCGTGRQGKGFSRASRRKGRK